MKRKTHKKRRKSRRGRRRRTRGRRRRRRRRSRRRRTKRRFGGQRDCLRICNDEIKKERVAWLNHYLNRKKQQRNILLASVNEGGLGAADDDPRVAAINGQLIKARAAKTEQELIRWAKGPAGDGVGGALGLMCGERLDDGQVVGPCSNENYNYHPNPPMDHWDPFAFAPADPGLAALRAAGQAPPAMRHGRVLPIIAPPLAVADFAARARELGVHDAVMRGAPWMFEPDGGGGGGGGEERGHAGHRAGRLAQARADAMAQHDRAGAL